MKRLFVGVDLDGLDAEIRRVQRRFEGIDGLRLTDPEGAHVTLQFLGDTDPDRIPDIVTALETAVTESGVGPFEARFGGLGAFPSRDYISVVWVGVRDGHGDSELTALHEAVEEHVTAMGFDADDHAFTPHVTIARMDHAAGKARVQRLLGERDPDVGRLAVDSIRLTESTLTEDGPVYSTVESVSL